MNNQPTKRNDPLGLGPKGYQIVLINRTKTVTAEEVLGQFTDDKFIENFGDPRNNLFLTIEKIEHYCEREIDSWIKNSLMDYLVDRFVMDPDMEFE